MWDYESLRHCRWDCKYHVVFIPKLRRKQLFGRVRRYLGPVFHELAWQKESRIIQGHMMPDHVHMCICIPPKYSVSQAIGYLEGQKCDSGGSPIGIATKIDLWKNKEVNSQFACFFNISAGFFQGLFLVKEVWRNLSCAYVYSSHIEMRPYK